MEDKPAEDEQRAVLSRRQAMRKIGGRAAAIGVGVWIAPEIIIGTPTAAGALSGPPDNSGGGAGGGAAGSPSSGGGASFAGAGGSSPGSDFADRQLAAGTTGTDSGSTGVAGDSLGTDSGVGAPPSSGSTPAAPATADSLFTAANVERGLGVAGGVVAGGWLLRTWSKGRGTDDPQPQSS